MKPDDALRLHNAWKAAHPGEICPHPELEKERWFQGQDTGDKVCTTCGEVLSPAQVEKLR